MARAFSSAPTALKQTLGQEVNNDYAEIITAYALTILCGVFDTDITRSGIALTNKIS